MDEIKLTVAGRLRRALISAPRHGRSAPLVILLHGAGGTPEWMIRETGWDALAVQEDFTLLAPEATRPNPKLPIRFYTNPPVWNDGSTRPPVNHVSGVDDVPFIRELIDQLKFPVDSRRIFVTGFSNGAGMTFRLGLELSDRIAAIAPVAGHLAVSGPKPKRPIPTTYMIGTADPLVPLRGGVVKTPWADANPKPPVTDSLRRWAELMGLPAKPEEIAADGRGVRHEIWAKGELEACYVEGLGHHWPGGRGELNPRIAGAPSDNLDGARTIWQFFRDRSL